MSSRPLDFSKVTNGGGGRVLITFPLIDSTDHVSLKSGITAPTISVRRINSAGVGVTMSTVAYDFSEESTTGLYKLQWNHDAANNGILSADIEVILKIIGTGFDPQVIVLRNTKYEQETLESKIDIIDTNIDDTETVVNSLTDRLVSKYEHDFKKISTGVEGIYSFSFPMIDAVNKTLYKSGLTVASSIYRIKKDGTTALITPIVSVTEIGTTGRYLFALNPLTATGNTIADTDLGLTISFTATGATVHTVNIENTAIEHSVLSGGSVTPTNMVISSGAAVNIDVRNADEVVYNQNTAGSAEVVITFSLQKDEYPKYILISGSIEGGDGFDILALNNNSDTYEKISDDLRNRIQVSGGNYLFAFPLKNSHKLWNGLLQVKLKSVSSVLNQKLHINYAAVFASNTPDYGSYNVNEVQGIPLQAGTASFPVTEFDNVESHLDLQDVEIEYIKTVVDAGVTVDLTPIIDNNNAQTATLESAVDAVYDLNVLNNTMLNNRLTNTDIMIDQIKTATTETIPDQVTLITEKLPSGTISDLTLTDSIDTVTLRSILERLLAMATGRIRKDYPSAGFVTLYKQDNITPLVSFLLTDSERVR